MIFTNFGTEGDILPLCALAGHARRYGWEPVFAISKCSAEPVRRCGFAIVYIADDLAGIRDHVNAMWIRDQDGAEHSEKLWKVLQPFRTHLETAFGRLLLACEGSRLLVSGAAQPLSRIVHDYSGIPFVSVQFSNFGGSGGGALDRAGQMLIDPVRRSLGLATVPHPLTVGANSPQLALYAFSAHLYPRPPNWPQHCHITGFWFLDDDGFSVDPKLVEFISDGPPPLVVALGSMSQHHDVSVRRTVEAACANCGVRVIVQGSADTRRVDKNLCETGYVPHKWLFARSAAVVSHGGAGTVGAVIRAGVPGIFIPHSAIYDQTYWARIVCDLGCSVEPIPLHDLSEVNLTTAIREVLINEQIRRRAVTLGHKISSEGGAKKAWAKIDEFARNLGISA